MALPIPIVAASMAAHTYGDLPSLGQGGASEYDALLGRRDSLETVRQPWAPSGGFLGPAPLGGARSWQMFPSRSPSLTSSSSSASSATVLPQGPAISATLWQRALAPLLRLLCC